MYNQTAKPAYELTCPNCGKTGKFYFDVVTPTHCSGYTCKNARLKRVSLQTGEGYVHRKKGY